MTIRLLARPAALWGAGSLALLAGALLMTRPDRATDFGSAESVLLKTRFVHPAGAVTSFELGQPAANALPGWLATYRGPKDKREVRAHAPAAAFAVSPGDSIHPGVEGPGFVAIFNGTLRVPAPGRYRLGAEVEGGTLSISLFGGAIKTPIAHRIDGARNAPGSQVNPVMGEWQRLPAGDINLRLEFTRAGDAPARLRTMWEKEGRGDAGFIAEPIPLEAVSIAPASRSAAADAASAARGRALLGVYGCMHCHEGDTPAVPDVDAPDLAGVGSRLDPRWMARWIANPQKHKPGSGMPSLFGARDMPEAESIAHYLASLGGPFEHDPVATEPAVRERGREVYTTVGCVACHGPADDPAGAGAPSPFGAIAGKWRASALAAFLKDPVARHPGGRMPSMLLADEESDALANYLVHAWGDAPAGTEPFLIDPQRVAAGERAFSARGCANCHGVGDEHHHGGFPGAKTLAQMDPRRGCLDPRDGKSPRYTLADADRAALAAAVAQMKTWPAHHNAPTDRATLAMGALGCTNCHEYNGAGGVREQVRDAFITLVETDLGDEGRLPPRLTGVGGKLTTPWLREVLTAGGRARPYMAARMPQHGELNAGALAEWLALADGVWANTDRPEPQVSDEMVRAGRRLAGDAGLNCISCHAFGNAPLAGTPGPDIAAFAERLRFDWYRRYILAPDRIKPGTRMPAFYATGTGSVTDVHGGDPRQQYEAMWAYFTLGSFAPAPEGLPTAKGLEIRVGERPVILRTFLKSAGSRGIAVGYPAGLHFAFDAENVRLAEVWRGAFLDATGAWAGRGGNVTGGQGPAVWTPPAGPAVVVADGDGAWPADPHTPRRFRGYRLDGAGVPTFLYSIGGGQHAVQVAERFEPAPQNPGAILRTFEITMPEGVSAVWLNPGAAALLPGAPQPATTVTSTEAAPLLNFPRPDGGTLKIVLEIKP